MIRIRLIEAGDDAAYRTLYQKLDRETPFRLYEPGERCTDLDDYQQEIHRFLAAPQSCLVVAEDTATGEFAGYLQGIGRPQQRVRHVVSINVAILQACTGKGLGAELFAFLEDWAWQNGVLRLDLSVMDNNEPAKKLYPRLGFEREGIKKRSMRLGNDFIDEIYMSKWLGNDPKNAGGDR